MSFVINTTIDKNQELLDAYKSLYRSGNTKDVFLISRNKRFGCDSFALALSSEFFKTILLENNREITNIVLPDVEPEIIVKIIEYIYNGQISLDAKNMAAFIDACNLLHLKATISCERKLVFDSTSSSKAEPQSTTTIKQSQLDSLIADLERDPDDDDIEEQHVEYHLKEEADINESGQLLEVYEISNIDASEIYAENDDEEMSGEDQYVGDLMDVVADDKEVLIELQKRGKSAKKVKISPESKIRHPPKYIDDSTMNKAITEIISHEASFGTVSEKYQIPKTLLWRRARKMGYVKSERPKDSTRILAIEAIKAGESLISLSKKFNIPISTLHREKLKLYEKGQLPENVNLRNRSRGDDYEERLRIAIAEILAGKSQNEVAKKHQIAKTTIWRIIKKLTPEEKEKINNYGISDEIIDRLIHLSKRRSVNAPGNSSNLEIISYSEIKEEDHKDTSTSIE